MVISPAVLVPGLTGLIFILAGWILFKYPPSTPNSIYGYRTLRSMSSKEKWDVAQKEGGKSMMRWGGFSFFMGVFGASFSFSALQGLLYGIITIVFAVAMTLISTERKLR